MQLINPLTSKTTMNMNYSKKGEGSGSNGREHNWEIECGLITE